MFHLLLNELAKVGACEICDYVKLCSQKSHYLATRALKQLICKLHCNYYSWKYGESKNKISHHNNRITIND